MTALAAVNSLPGIARIPVWITISIIDAGLFLCLMMFLTYFLTKLSVAVGPLSRKRTVQFANLFPAQPTDDKSWLAIVDRGDYAKSWEKVADSFQRTISKEEWVARLEKVRRPLGKVISRKVRSITYSPYSRKVRSLKDAAVGMRFEQKFNTSFDGLLAAVETMICSKQPDGSWRVSGYLIRPAGFKRFQGRPIRLIFLLPLLALAAILAVWSIEYRYSAPAKMFTLLDRAEQKRLCGNVEAQLRSAGYQWKTTGIAYDKTRPGKLNCFVLYLEKVENSGEATIKTPVSGSMNLKQTSDGSWLAQGVGALNGLQFTIPPPAIYASDYIGQAYFPKGDSIEITSVKRSPERMVVKGHYNLVSHDQVTLALYITSTNRNVPEDSQQRMQISKGRGDFELTHRHLVPGWPHVSMYADGGSFAVVYFGTKAEALEESKLPKGYSLATSDASQLIQDGWQLWQARRLNEATAKFQEAVKLAPDDANAWNGLGWATFNSGKSQEAEKAFQKAVPLEPDHPAALNGLGQIYLSQRKYDEAEKYLLKAAPQAPAAWYGLARLYLLQGKFARAEEWAQKVVDSGQGDEIANKMLQAAKDERLNEGLRIVIEPRSSGNPPSTSAQPTLPTSALQFRLVVDDSETNVPTDTLTNYLDKARFEQLRVMQEVLMDGKAVERAGWYAGPDSQTKIMIGLTETGSQQFEALTAANLKRRIAIVFQGRVLFSPIIQSRVYTRSLEFPVKWDRKDLERTVNGLNQMNNPVINLRFGPEQENVLPTIEWNWTFLNLRANRLMTNSHPDSESRAFHDWQHENGADLVATVADVPATEEKLPSLIGYGMATAPAAANGLDNNSPADIWYNWNLMVNEPEAESHLAKMPNNGQDTYYFRTRDDTWGILQITGFTENPRGVKIRYKLVQNGNAIEKTANSLPSTNAIAADVNDNTGVADAAAQNWLALIDAGNYSETWKEASAVFRGAVTEPGWENSMNTFRQPLGNLVSRKLKSAEHLTEMPGAPDGQYVLMQFETSFANKKSAIETVTFMMEKDGQWKSCGYFIK